MPQPSTTLRVPQPCHESWAAMTPTALGRHCAACQKTVIDFTQKTDAELLAYFAQAKGETCGHFYSDQLERPMQLAPPVAPGSRWRAWLALALAAWSTTQAVAASPGAAHPMHSSPRRVPVRSRTSTLATKYVRGTVRDAATGAPLAGAAVFLRGENRMASTDSAGRFRLRLSPRRPMGGRALVVHYMGYLSEVVRVPATTRVTINSSINLRADPAALGAQVTGYQVEHRREVTGGAAFLIIEPKELPSKPTTRPPGAFRRWLKGLFH